MSSRLRQLVRAVPLGHSESAVVVEIGNEDLNGFTGCLKEAYKKAGPRLGVSTIPAFMQEERRKQKASKKRAAKPEDEGKSGGASAPGDKGKPAYRTIVLYRPVHIRRRVENKEEPAKAVGSNKPGDAKPAPPSPGLPNAKLDLGNATLVIISPGVTIENVDIIGSGRPGLDWGESHALVEVAGRGDLQMLDCSITLVVPTPPGALYPQPSKNCGALLVEQGARATVDNTAFKSSPLGYGVVARDPGTRVLLEGCELSGSYHGNVLACRRSRISLISCAVVSSSPEGYGLSALDTGTVAYCKDTTFLQNSRDNVFCGMGARTVLEGCTVQASKLRSGFKVDGAGSSGYVRELLPALPIDDSGDTFGTFGLHKEQSTVSKKGGTGGAGSAGGYGLDTEVPSAGKKAGAGGAGGYGLDSEEPSRPAVDKRKGGGGSEGSGGYGLDSEEPSGAAGAKAGAAGKEQAAAAAAPAKAKDTSKTAKSPTVFSGNKEHAVHARWGAWASIRGCRYAIEKADKAETTQGGLLGKGSDKAAKDAYSGSGDGASGPGSDWVPCLMEGPTTCVVQDPSLGRPEWRYLSASERPWTARHAHGEALSTVLERADLVAAQEVERQRSARDLMFASGSQRSARDLLAASGA